MVGLAQLAEHQIVVLRVVGSTPTTHPNYYIFIVHIKNISESNLKFIIDIFKYLFIINASTDIFQTYHSD